MTREQLDEFRSILGRSFLGDQYPLCSFLGWTVAFGPHSLFAIQDTDGEELPELHEELQRYFRLNVIGRVDSAYLREVVGTLEQMTVQCPKCADGKLPPCDECTGGGEETHQCNECDESHTAVCNACDGAGTQACECIDGKARTPQEQCLILIGDKIFDRYRLAPLVERLEGATIDVSLIDDVVLLSTDQTRALVIRMRDTDAASARRLELEALPA